MHANQWSSTWQKRTNAEGARGGARCIKCYSSVSSFQYSFFRSCDVLPARPDRAHGRVKACAFE